MTLEEKVRISVNPFPSDNQESLRKKSQQVEDVSYCQDPLVEEVLSRYLRLPFDEFTLWGYRKGYIECPQILTPVQIEKFMHLIRSKANPEYINHPVSGAFISNLVRSSYKAGYNDFVLSTGDYAIDSITYKFNGNDDSNMMRYRIEGASVWPKHLRFCQAVYDGPIQGLSPFEKSYHCRITVNGDVLDHACFQSVYSTFVFNGKVGFDGTIRSSHCTFIFNSDVAENPGRDTCYCRFVTERPDVFRHLSQEVNWHHNIVQLINEKGEVMQEVKR